MRRRVRFALALLLTLPALAWAQAGDDELASLRRDFEFGKFDEVFQRAQARLDAGGLSDPQVLLELHQLAGISAFNLGRRPDAERHLSAVLRIDPDYALDPFVYPPATINFLERLRKQLSPELDGIRQERRLEAARRRAAAEAAERERIRQEEQRRRIEALSRRVTVRTVERRSFLVNFIPFGAGQFQQGRNSLGILLASAQGAFAATSILAYWAHQSLYETRAYSFAGNVGADGQVYRVTLTGIPESRRTEAEVWRMITAVSAIGFYGMYAYGVLDASIRHQDQIITTQTVDEAPAQPGTSPQGAPSDGAPAPAPTTVPPRTRRDALPPSFSFGVAPVPGGAAASLTLAF